MSGERKVGENFDSDKADSIFDKLKNISNLMNEAKYLENKGKLDEAIDLYKQVIFELPDASKAYGALANIYAKQGDVNSEKDVLKKAISNCKDNKDFKNRLKEIE